MCAPSLKVCPNSWLTQAQFTHNITTAPVGVSPLHQRQLEPAGPCFFPLLLTLQVWLELNDLDRPYSIYPDFIVDGSGYTVIKTATFL